MHSPGGDAAAGDTFLRALLDHSSDVITILNARGTILFQSPSVRSILGYEQDALVGTDALARVHPDDLEQAQDILRLPSADGCSHGPTTYRYLHRDGSWRVLEATSRRRLGGVVVNARDVTEALEAKAALERSEQLFRSLFENAADLVTILDETGSIRYGSPSAERVTGRRPESLLGRNLFDFVHADDRERIGDTFRKILRTPGEVHAFELSVRHRDGSWRVLDGLARNLLDDPAVRGIVANSRDVTDRKEAEAALIRARDAAEAASRAKSDFLSSMSHELRTPLNSVIGFTNVLRRNRAGNQREQDLAYLGRILANGKHLLGLIDDILDLSKVEAGKMELEIDEVAVDRLLLETLAEVKGTVGGKPVELRVSSPDRVATLRTDPVRLKQVLINLVGNAIKFTERGTVTVRLTVEPETHRPLRIDVVDSGVGIPADRLAHIFRAFEQAESGTARRFGGTGLGLAISSSLTELMGFRLTARSVEGSGSTFSILLGPDAEQAADSGIAPREVGEPFPPPDAAPTTPSGKLVLVIDDEIESRMLLTAHLEELGCATIAASTAEQGLRMAREFGPDLITLDLLLPGTPGLEILGELKRDPALRRIPVVVVSVVAAGNRGRVGGGVELLEKPVEREALLAVLRRHFEASPDPREGAGEREPRAREDGAGEHRPPRRLIPSA